MALNTQLTTTSAISVTNPAASYYDRKLIKDMKPKLVNYEYGQKRPMPRHNGKTVNFRKFTPFAALTTPLGEGVIPSGQSLAMTEVIGTVVPYAGYVAMSDFLDMTAIDPVVVNATELMSDQAALTIDTLVRDETALGTNVLYAATDSIVPTARWQVTVATILNTTAVRKAVRLLKKNKAPMFSRGGQQHYIAIVGPDTVFDLQSDSLWQDVSKYSDKEAIYSGEIGRWFGVVFIETNNPKTWKGANLTAAAANLTNTAGGYVTATKVMTVAEAITADEATAMVGRKVIVGYTTPWQDTIAAAAAGVAGAATITLTTGYAGTNTDLNGKTVYPGEAGAANVEVTSTVFFGKDAYGVVDIEGSGNSKIIVHNRGESGVSDPVNQISTVGWKVEAFDTVILQQAWLVRVDHGVTA